MRRRLYGINKKRPAVLAGLFLSLLTAKEIIS